jgi:uncharacterized membrane protein (UPF0182 family)
MPQLKKVVLAMGDRLIYRDTFDEALADLTGAPAPVKQVSTAVESGSAQTPSPNGGGQSVAALAERLRHLRDEAEQLARELEALEKDTVKK